MIKVEMHRMESRGIIAFKFESSSSNEDDLELLDCLAEGLLGPYVREGGFMEAKRFVLHIHDPLLKDPKPEPVAKVKTVK